LETVSGGAPVFCLSCAGGLIVVRPLTAHPDHSPVGFRRLQICCTLPMMAPHASRTSSGTALQRFVRQARISVAPLEGTAQNPGVGRAAGRHVPRKELVMPSAAAPVDSECRRDACWRQPCWSVRTPAAPPSRWAASASIPKLAPLCCHHTIPEPRPNAIITNDTPKKA
jgi:hypothetical protein